MRIFIRQNGILSAEFTGPTAVKFMEEARNSLKQVEKAKSSNSDAVYAVLGDVVWEMPDWNGTRKVFLWQTNTTVSIQFGRAA